MNREVLSRYDLLTVGECCGLTVEQAARYANAQGTELNMAFQFEHMDLDGGESFKWNLRKIDLVELKQLLSKWQYGLQDRAWNSLYWCNHDQPRIVSRLGDDSKAELRERSAKALALVIHMMQGTPYIYQGEELGMTNYPFETIEDFRDVESINAYRELTQRGVIASEDMLKFLRYKSRDNARTPVQWDDSTNAGFTTGTPWIGVNPNYREINAAQDAVSWIQCTLGAAGQSPGRFVRDGRSVPVGHARRPPGYALVQRRRSWLCLGCRLLRRQYRRSMDSRGTSPVYQRWRTWNDFQANGREAGAGDPLPESNAK